MTNGDIGRRLMDDEPEREPNPEEESSWRNNFKEFGVKSLDFTKSQGKKLVDIAKSRPRASAAIGASLLAGFLVGYCGNKDGSDIEFPKYATGTVFNQRTNTEDEQSLERHIFYGEQFYVEKTDVEEGQLPFTFIRFEDSGRLRDLDSGKERIISDREYVSQRVNSTYSHDGLADQITLSSEDSPETGVKGVRATIPAYDEIRRQAGASETSIGFSAKDVIGYSIDRVEIFGDKYFLIHVENSKRDEEGRLNFYLIPEKDAQILTNNRDGSITLINENNIYRPILYGLRENSIEGNSNAQSVR